MFQNVLKEIGGIGIYDLISICLFVLVFTGMLIRVWVMKKPFLESMSTLPLDDNGPATRKGESDHE